LKVNNQPYSDDFLQQSKLQSPTSTFVSYWWHFDDVIVRLQRNRLRMCRHVEHGLFPL